MKKRLIGGAVALSVVTGSIGVYAGTVISQYKTPRGNIATVEQENIHKNRIGLTVNGKEIKQETWYHDQAKTYVPLRAVSEALGAEVNYNQETMSADITLPTQQTPKPSETKDLIIQSDLPYTLNASNSMSLTINSYSASSDEVVFNVTITNNSKTSDKGDLMTSTWEVYDGKSTLKFVDQDQALWDISYLRAGQSITGDIKYEGLSQETDSISLFGSLWQYIDSDEFKLNFKIN